MAEALHGSAATDVPGLMAALAAELGAVCAVPAACRVDPAAPRFAFGDVQ